MAVAMWKDLVKCCWCMWKGTVDRGAEECPSCHTKGHLAWQDPDNPEVEE